MSLPHFYLDNQVLADETDEVFRLRLAEDDAKHARVLRLAPGEHLAVVDAAKDYFECEIASFDRDACFVRIAQKIESAPRLPEVTLVQGIAKGEKMDGIVRHATEIGVARFVPFACERSVVKLDAKKAASRTARWRTIAKSAAMQSGQPRVPEVSEPMGLEGLRALAREATAVLVCWEEERCASVRSALAEAVFARSVKPEDAQVLVVVGPEGGLTGTEVRALCGENPHSHSVSLGASILRTETAGLIAPALVLYELGGLR